MLLLDHISITVPRLDEARPFYDAVMDALGASKVYDREDALGYGERCRAGDADTPICRSSHPRTPAATRAAIGASTPSRSAVDRFHAAGLAHGGRDDGAPGLRPHYHPHYYAAFLLDPAASQRGRLPRP